ncbi:hypothetical protein TNIN_91431 [Trichonephila inaurata madagascariensis]|uniref:Uncharacterized protein n=1 Tax=Trichonephila inaurata madagascariensis TaxID=2747483 RepID=A0A8X6YTE7_9ARAC|nr:hypothetical protein TNIN_91431 [Trichonephila inaurata madagascariensis]
MTTRQYNARTCLQNLIHFNFVGVPSIPFGSLHRRYAQSANDRKTVLLMAHSAITSSLPPRRARQRPSVKTRPPKCHSKNPGAFPAEHRTCGGHQASPCATQTRDISLGCSPSGFRYHSPQNFNGEADIEKRSCLRW